MSYGYNSSSVLLTGSSSGSKKDGPRKIYLKGYDELMTNGGARNGPGYLTIRSGSFTQNYMLINLDTKKPLISRQTLSNEAVLASGNI